MNTINLCKVSKKRCLEIAKNLQEFPDPQISLSLKDTVEYICKYFNITDCDEKYLIFEATKQSFYLNALTFQTDQLN